MTMEITPINEREGQCGVATLKMLLKKFGIEKTTEEIHELLEFKNNGTSAEQMVSAAQKAGLNAFVMESGTIGILKSFTDIGFPVAVDWFSEDDGHWSIITKVTDKSVWMIDPEGARIRRFTHEKFLRIWFDYHHEYPLHSMDFVIRQMVIIFRDKLKIISK